MDRTIILGSKVDLHDGVHGSLVDVPPSGVSFDVRPATHRFLFPDRARRSPHCDFHFGECVDFGAGPEVVHSARWPVLGRRSWITDMDDFGYPTLVGRALLNPAVRHLLTDVRGESDMRKRLVNMLAMYVHPSCAAVVFRTHNGLRDAARQIADLDAGSAGEQFLYKACVVYPAQPACAHETLERKWADGQPLTVVFCGRDFEAKNGAMALRIFDLLAERWPKVTFIHVGEVPVEVREAYHRSNVTLLGVVPRQRVFDTLKAGHILFHPSQFESVGIVLLEAAASGMAIVVGTGRGMAHVDELFGEGGALSVDRDRVTPADEEVCFSRRLEALLAAPDVAKCMALDNHREADRGRFSMAKRNDAFASLYARAAEVRSEPLSFDDVPHVKSDAVVSLAALDVLADQTAFLRQIGIERRHVNIQV